MDERKVEPDARSRVEGVKRMRLGRLGVQRTATKDEAAKLIGEFGDAAYAKAREAERNARRRRNEKLAKFLGKVARRIARDSKVRASGNTARSSAEP